MPWLTVVLTVLLLVVLVLFLPGQWSRGRDERDGAPSPPRGAYRDDDRYWYGFIYDNPNDPDLFVPKRFGRGWTINFGHPWGKLVLIVTLLVPVLMMLLQLLVTGAITPVGCHPSTGCHLFP